MGLRWFAFDADAYTGDTAHLTTEEHGAYLLLMLAYYRSEKPLPASDRGLAAITRLPMDRWLECKPTLAPFFMEDVYDGRLVWRHERIEAEIRDGYEKQKKFAERAKAGSEARWGHRKRMLQASPQAMQQASENEATLTLTNNSLSAVLTGDSGEKVDNDLSIPAFLKREQPVAPPVVPVEEQESAVDEPPVEQMTPVDPNFHPPGKLKIEALSFMDEVTLETERQKFILHHQAEGSLSADWGASFGIWIARAKQYAERAAKPRGKPRVELNNSQPDPNYQINWSWHLQRWLKDESSWSRRTAGPEPGQPGCRVPPEMFERFKIDPETGRKKQEA